MINAVLLGIIALPLLIVLLPLILLFFIVLRIQEFVDAQAPLPPPLPVDPRLFAHEDVYIMNHLTTMVNVKPGAFRLRTLKVILWVVNLLAKAYFTTGNIGGIPTIHFARWLLMENDRRLLFFSNYDGSWASYLGDFVDKANYGLTAIWSNTDRFPPSQFLFWAVRSRSSHSKPGAGSTTSMLPFGTAPTPMRHSGISRRMCACAIRSGKS